MKQKRGKATTSSALVPTGLVPELRELIETTRRSVARGVNTALVQLYWQIGARIRKDILANRRAEYGEGDFCDTVTRIGGRLWLRLFHLESVTHGAIPEGRALMSEYMHIEKHFLDLLARPDSAVIDQATGSCTTTLIGRVRVKLSELEIG
jgi:hypothetical protein